MLRKKKKKKKTLIAIEQLRELAGGDDLANHFFQIAFVNPIRDGSDNDLFAFAVGLGLPLGLNLDASCAFFVNLAEGSSVCDDLASQREVRDL